MHIMFYIFLRFYPFVYYIFVSKKSYNVYILYIDVDIFIYQKKKTYMCSKNGSEILLFEGGDLF